MWFGQTTMMGYRSHHGCVGPSCSTWHHPGVQNSGGSGCGSGADAEGLAQLLVSAPVVVKALRQDDCDTALQQLSVMLDAVKHVQEADVSACVAQFASSVIAAVQRHRQQQAEAEEQAYYASKYFDGGVQRYLVYSQLMC